MVKKRDCFCDDSMVGGRVHYQPDSATCVHIIIVHFCSTDVDLIQGKDHIHRKFILFLKIRSLAIDRTCA